MNEEILQRAVMLQQQSQEAEKQLAFVDEQIGELEAFSKNLDFMDKSQEKEVLASLGKGVFVKSDIKDKKLFVDVGAGVLVRKTASEAREVIEGQLKKFMEARVQVAGQLEALREELGMMIGEIEKLKAGQKS